MEPKLSQEMIIQSAFTILAETQELSKLSMRNLAQKNDVKAPALYWHFKNKQELLQKMAEVMENELVIPDPHLPWQERLVQFMENYYDLYTQFPCGAELEINTIPSYGSRLEHLEIMIQILIQEGFSLNLSRQAVAALHNLLIGQLMDHQHEQNLRQKIISGNHFLKDAIFSMKSYVEDHELSGLKASIAAHGREEEEKQTFLDSVNTYLQGLNLQKDQ
ncbi:TetR family transcriptional regulator [Enterococcus villorum]|uniref:TetR family transcriptional regulator n=2 Tax=Enterococcus villorum TaxID=112904 RepID=A0A511J541_9ENTE|nr:TetR family transcriptional regulator [Enterococcus villorum]EOH93468.1 TetR family transcriptional regulator [Enterococcus villorum ATCC 700913]EOW75419.1 TetR family transcriptional regulator [Enterococcus villorum ATCC 700913]GEL93115.1 TetR family transcriptional regulator [Enterococcus villorum]